MTHPASASVALRLGGQCAVQIHNARRTDAIAKALGPGGVEVAFLAAGAPLQAISPDMGV